MDLSRDSDAILNGGMDGPAAQTQEPIHPPKASRTIIPRDLGIMLNHKRKTTAPHHTRGIGTGWLDKDDSGTYDPKLQRATPPSTPPRHAKRVRPNNGEPRAQGNGTKRPAVGYGLMVTLAFTSEEGKAYLRSISPGPYTPGGIINEEASETEVDSDAEYQPKRKTRKKKAKSKTPVRSDGLTIDDLTLGHPQRRGCKACFEFGDDECSLLENIHEYPCFACDDAGIDCELIIPPELKKPCERCKKKRIGCSYREDGGLGVSTCDTCAEVGEKCYAAPVEDASMSRRYNDVLTPAGTRRRRDHAAPRQYVSCNQCRYNHLKCNLKRDGPGPCRHCKNAGEACQFQLGPPRIRQSTAGSVGPPADGRASAAPNGKKKVKGKAKNKNLDRARSPGPQDLSPGSFEHSFYQNISEESWYKGAGNMRPRNIQDPKHQPGYSKKQEKLNEKYQRMNASKSLSYSPSHSPELMGMTNGKPHIKIKTCFAHPILFNFIPSPDGTKKCSWCEFPFFGLFGHGEITVEVIAWPDGSGYEEVGEGKYKGWAQQDYAQTVMCGPCTNVRVGIMTCEVHEFEKLTDVDPRSFMEEEWQKSIEALGNDDMEGGRLVMETKYCSICPSIAEYRCISMQSHDLDSLAEEDHSHEDDEGKRGCGLLACQTCMDLVTIVEGAKATTSKWEDTTFNVLDRVIKLANGRWAGNYSDGTRADSSFLTSDGELVRRIWSQDAGLAEAEASGWMNDVDKPISISSDSNEDHQGPEDKERQMIYSRVGEGRGRWNEKIIDAPSEDRPRRKRRSRKHEEDWMGEPLVKLKSPQNKFSVGFGYAEGRKGREEERMGKSVVGMQSSEGSLLGVSMDSTKPKKRVVVVLDDSD